MAPPSLRSGEVVQIISCSDPELAWVVGQEGVVHDASGPDETGTGWTYSVWADAPEPEGRVLWIFGERELAPTGWIEDDKTGERTETSKAPAVAPLKDVVHVRLRTSVVDEDDARLISRRATDEIQRRAGRAEIAVRLEPYWQPPHPYELIFDVKTPDVYTAFDALAAAPTGSWRIEDDGWRCDWSWIPPRAVAGASFLGVDELVDAFVIVEPWSDPTRRPPAQRRQQPD